MSLTDGDVALLARQAVELLDPDLDIRIEPSRRSDPYRLMPGEWTVRPVVDVRPTFGIRLVAGMSRPQALAELIHGLSAGVAESPRFWARRFPTCGEHPHAAVAVVDGETVSVRCPETGEERVRIEPETP